jgi:hypothetical protein
MMMVMRVIMVMNDEQGVERIVSQLSLASRQTHTKKIS